MTAWLSRLRCPLLSAAWLAFSAVSMGGEGARKALVVSAPDGACRLSIFRDGSGSIQYGAAPHTVHVPRQTFDFERAMQDVRGSALLLRQDGITSDSVPASFMLPGSAHVHALADAALVRGLIMLGWQASSPAGTAREEAETRRWLRHACDLE